ncbi:MAG: PepSY-associated TM helix domain-containing protein [Janthinobacterium lividum]
MNNRIWFAWHRWLGLVAGLFAVSLSLTGAFLALRHPYERTANRAALVVRPTGPRLPYDQLLAAASRQVPDFQFYDRADLPQAPDQALELHHLPNGHYASVFVDPYTGRVTGGLGPGHFSRTLLRFHWSFALGESGYVGAVVALLVALCMLGAVVTGAVVYRKHLRKVLLFRERVAWQGGRRTVASLHRVLGVWAWLFMLVLFSTGAYLNYITVSGSFTYATPAELRQPPQQPLASAGASADRMLAQARRALPGLQATAFTFPQQLGGGYTVEGRLPTDNALLTPLNVVNFNAQGRLLRVDRGRDASARTKLENLLFALHFATYGGLALKLLYCLMGVLSGSLPITGALLWWQRERQAKKQVGRRTPPSSH